MDPTEFSTARHEHDASVWTVRVTGELDLATAPRLEAMLDEVLRSEPSTVLLGLERVAFLDSTGIRVIVTARKQLEARGAHLVIDGVSGAVQQVLEVSGLLDDLTRPAD